MRSRWRRSLLPVMAVEPYHTSLVLIINVKSITPIIAQLRLVEMVKAEVMEPIYSNYKLVVVERRKKILWKKCTSS